MWQSIGYHLVLVPQPIKQPKMTREGGNNKEQRGSSNKLIVAAGSGRSSTMVVENYYKYKYSHFREKRLIKESWPITRCLKNRAYVLFFEAVKCEIRRLHPHQKSKLSIYPFTRATQLPKRFWPQLQFFVTSVGSLQNQIFLKYLRFS